MNEQFNDKVMNSVNDEDLLFDWCLASQFAVKNDFADQCLKKLRRNGLQLETILLSGMSWRCISRHVGKGLKNQSHYKPGFLPMKYELHIASYTYCMN